MPLSHCPRCGHVSRILWPVSDSPSCPDCDAKMNFVGRQSLGHREPFVADLLRFRERPAKRPRIS